jgi:hypothetical protein
MARRHRGAVRGVAREGIATLEVALPSSPVGQAPGVRRLVRKREGDCVVTESPNPEDRDPRWCAAFGREMLPGLARYLHCGGAPLTTAELARLHGDRPPPPGRGPASWQL